ncbi:MAG TPA: hypothetical protein VHL11_14525, partial [Phototrophicaceae bacterium]|nr:hypothetical protein [Phototrophicaceae bacterium]
MSANYQAVIFEAPQGSEVIGSLLLPYFDNLASDDLDPILKRHGLVKDEINPEGWYAMQVLMDISRALSSTGISPG